MQEFKDWNLKVKETFNATSKEVVLTVTEAGRTLGLSKDNMKQYVEKHKLTKIPISRSVHRYLLLKSELDQILDNRFDDYSLSPKDSLLNR
ncbi:DNA-binding protein [Paenibacillus harenae]|uniref:DNA-binding protein n=1 Tax=Paenibacillus harenae TaxID=306543 RepID=UPI000423CCF4|nr:DNA-binding protein [Paenibacillus harenae]